MLKKYFFKKKLLLLFSFILSAVFVYAVIIQPNIISNIISKGINRVDKFGNVLEPDQKAIAFYTTQLLIWGLVALIAGILNTILSSIISQNISSKLREDLFIKIQKLSISEIEKFEKSSLIVRLTNDINQIQNFIMILLQMMIRIPLLFIGSFILAIRSMPSLWWTIILFIILVAMILFLSLKRVGPKFGIIQKTKDDLNKTIKENLDGVRVIKSFVQEKNEEKRFEKQVDTFTRNTISVGKTFSIIIPGFMLIANLIIIFAIFSTSKIAIDDPSKMGSLASFINYIFQIMFSILMMGFFSMSISQALTSIKRTKEIMNFKNDDNFGTLNKKINGDIEFKNVYFKYDDDKEYFLKNINFKIKRGEKIGIIGLTGSGKTTIANLLTRFYKVSKGEIKLDDKNINDFSEESLSKNISIIIQKAMIFSGNIKENIKQGNKKSSQKDIEKAAKNAVAYEFIKKYPEKFNHKTEQKGSNFSGGQKQRLSISRAFVKDSNILILDDSTSALDAKSENKVKENLNKNFKYKTVIIITQKVSSIYKMDKIFVLNKGKIEAIGNHKELLEKSKTYQKIVKTQEGIK